MMIQLIYISQPFGYDASTLSAILSTARRNNPLHGITGALICRHDVYLQLLEGDAEAVDPLFERISKDNRHLAVTLLSRTETGDRLFPDWDMLHDPAHSWHWTEDEVNDGALTRASTEELQAVFRRVAVETTADRPAT